MQNKRRCLVPSAKAGPRTPTGSAGWFSWRRRVSHRPPSRQYVACVLVAGLQVPPHWTGAGELIGVLPVASDITARQRAVLRLLSNWAHKPLELGLDHCCGPSGTWRLRPRLPPDQALTRVPIAVAALVLCQVVELRCLVGPLRTFGPATRTGGLARSLKPILRARVGALLVASLFWMAFKTTRVVLVCPQVHPHPR